MKSYVFAVALLVLAPGLAGAADYRSATPEEQKVEQAAASIIVRAYSVQLFAAECLKRFDDVGPSLPKPISEFKTRTAAVTNLATDVIVRIHKARGLSEPFAESRIGPIMNAAEAQFRQRVQAEPPTRKDCERFPSELKALNFGPEDPAVRIVSAYTKK